MSLNDSWWFRNQSGLEQIDQTSLSTETIMDKSPSSNIDPQAFKSNTSQTSYLEINEFGSRPGQTNGTGNDSHGNVSNMSETPYHKDTSEVLESNSSLPQNFNSGLDQTFNAGQLGQTFNSDSGQTLNSGMSHPDEPRSKPFNTSQNKNEGGEQPEMPDLGSPVDPKPNYESYYKYDTTSNVTNAAYPYQWGSTASRMEANRAMRSLGSAPAAYSKHAFTLADLPHLDNDTTSAGSFSRQSSYALDRKYSTSYGSRNSLMDFDAINTRVSSATMDTNGTMEERIKMMSKVLEDIKDEGTSVDHESRSSVDYENGYTRASYVSRIPSVYGSLNVERIRLKTLNDLLNTTSSTHGNVTDSHKMWLPHTTEEEGYAARVSSRGSSTDYTSTTMYGRPAWGGGGSDGRYGSRRGSDFTGNWSTNKSVGQSYSNPYVTGGARLTSSKSKSAYQSYRHVGPKVSSFRTTPSNGGLSGGSFGRRQPSQRSSSTGRYSSGWDKTPSFSKFKESNWNVNKSASKHSQQRGSERQAQNILRDQPCWQQAEDNYAPILDVATEPVPDPETPPPKKKEKPTAARKKRKSKLIPYVPMANKNDQNRNANQSRKDKLEEQGMWARVNHIFDRVINERNDIPGDLKIEHESEVDKVHEDSGVGHDIEPFQEQKQDHGILEDASITDHLEQNGNYPELSVQNKEHVIDQNKEHVVDKNKEHADQNKEHADQNKEVCAQLKEHVGDHHTLQNIQNSNSIAMNPYAPSLCLPERLAEFMKKLNQSKLQRNESLPEPKKESAKSLDQQKKVIDETGESEMNLTKYAVDNSEYTNGQQGLGDIANIRYDICIDQDRYHPVTDATSMLNNNDHQEAVFFRVQQSDESNNQQNALEGHQVQILETAGTGPLAYSVPRSQSPASRVYHQQPNSENSKISARQDKHPVRHIGVDQDRYHPVTDVTSISNNNEHQEKLISRVQPSNESIASGRLSTRTGGGEGRGATPLELRSQGQSVKSIARSVYSSRYTVTPSQRPANHVYHTPSNYSHIMSARQVWLSLKRGISDSTILSDKQVRRFVGLIGISEADNNIPGWRKKKCCSSIGGMFFTPLVRKRLQSKHGGSWNKEYKLKKAQSVVKALAKQRQMTNNQIYANTLVWVAK